MMNNRDFSEDLMTVLMAADEFPSKIQFPISLNQEMEGADIEHFVETARAANALRRNKIHTAKSVLEMFDQLDCIRNLGIKSVKEVKNGFLNWYYGSLEETKVKEFWNDFVQMNNLTAIAR